MTFIPSGGGSSSVIAGVPPNQAFISKILSAAGVCYSGSQVDLLSNGGVQNSGGLDNNSFTGIVSVNTPNTIIGIQEYPQVVHLGNNRYFVLGQKTITANTMKGVIVELGENLSSISVIYSDDIVATSVNLDIFSITRISDYKYVVMGSNSGSNGRNALLCTFDSSFSSFTKNNLSSATTTSYSGTPSCTRMSDTSFLIVQPIVSNPYGMQVLAYENTTLTDTVTVFSGSQFDTTSKYKQVVASMNSLGDFVIQGWYDASNLNVLYVGSLSSGSISLSATYYNVPFSTFAGTSYQVLLSPSENVGLLLDSTSASYLLFDFDSSAKTISFRTAQASLIPSYFASLTSSQRSLGLPPFDGAVLVTTPTSIRLYKVNGSLLDLVVENTDLSSNGITAVSSAYNAEFDQFYVQGYGVSAEKDALVLDGKTLTTSISAAANAVYLTADAKISALSTSAGIALDSSNFRLFSISDDMYTEAIDTSTAHSLSSSIFEISKVSATQSIGAFIVSGVVNLKVAENPSGTTLNVGAADTFATGVTAIDVSSQLVVYSDGTQVAVRAFTVAGSTITSGSELQLQTSTSSSVSVVQLAADKAIVSTDIAAYLVTISGTTATLTDSIAINGDDTIDQVSVSAISATEAIVFYRSSSKSNTVWGVLVTEAVSALSLDTPRQLSPGNSSLKKSAKSSSIEAVMAYVDGSDSKNKIAVVNRSLLVVNKFNVFSDDQIVDDLEYLSDGKILVSNDARIFNIEGSDAFYTIAREDIGIAKQNAYASGNVTVELYGVSELTSFSGLTVGDSILASDGSEAGYAISDSVVIQLPEVTV